MAISEYWVGEIPSEPIRITIVDNDNTPVNLAGFSGFSARMLGTDNEELDLTDAVLLNTGGGEGTLVFRLPNGRSLFNKSGEYLLQIRLDGATGTKEYTDAHLIRVREFGGKN